MPKQDWGPILWIAALFSSLLTAALTNAPLTWPRARTPGPAASFTELVKLLLVQLSRACALGRAGDGPT